MSIEDGMSGINGIEIAIIGMAGRFPGATSVAQLWRNLADGVETIATFGEAELRAAGVTAEEAAHPLYVKRGGVLAGAEDFDATFFGIYPREADIIDPQQRIFLEVAWEALEHAGYNPEAYTGAIGVYAGTGMNTYLLTNLLRNRSIRETVHSYQLGMASDKDYLPTRVSYKLNLRGPSVTVQTACSTSLVATHLACQGLLSYQCDMALAGGVTVRVPQTAGYLYLEGGIVSPDGYCRAFDTGAAGTVSGNGAGIVVLKRLEDALLDGDTIYAVIKGSAINNDGSQKVGYTAPSVEGQAEVIAMAQSLADVHPESITYVEAHGTGTALGDPIEIAALTEVFHRATQRRQFCAIGSVKTNVGHLDAAAGVTSLIKTALALEHRQIPPSLHYTAPNPQIDFPSTPFYVNTRLRDWQAGEGPRRAGVSSFGIGGTNAHVVLEEAPRQALGDGTRAWQVLLLSARTAEALEAATDNLARFLVESAGTSNLADVAYTLQVGRKAFQHRRAVVCRDVAEARAGLAGQGTARVLDGVAPEGQPPVVFMLTGQGAQHAGMGRGLYESEPVFRQEVDRCCEALRPILGLDLRELLFPAAGDKEVAGQRLTQTAMAQPALFVVEYALARLWISWGVRPQAMIGHSIGEYVAACLAGVMVLEDALALVAERGRLMQGLPGGSMLSVPLGESEVQPYLAGEPELALAAVNGPGLSVVSGPGPAVDRLAQRLTAAGVEGRRLVTSHAFHSGMMDPILEPFAAAVRRVRLAPPQVPFVSNVTGTWITAQQAMDPAYWARHLRQPVRFADGLVTLAEEPARVYLEVGPGRTLATLARATLGTGPAVAHSMRHPARGEAADDQGVLLAALSQLWLAGVAPEWVGFYGREFRRRVPLPTYPFERQRHWVAPDMAWGDGPSLRAGLEKRPDVGEWLYVPAWHRADVPGRAGLPAGERWLVLAGGDELSAVVVRGLREAGVDVVVVEESGSTWGNTDGHGRIRTPEGEPQRRIERKVDPWAGGGQSGAEEEPQSVQRAQNRSWTEEGQSGAGGELQGARREEWGPKVQGLEAVVARVLEEGPVQRVVHLWGAKRAEAGTERERFEQAQARGFGSLVGLAQAWGRHGAGHRAQIDVITAGVQEVTGEEELLPERATVLGPCLVIPQEQPEISCRAIDLAMDGGASAEEIAARVLAELAVAPGEPVVALRGRHRWVQRFDQVRVPDVATPRLRQEGVYLITGGLGRIGFALAEHLAARYRARLALVDRSPLPEAGQWEGWLESHGEDDLASRKIRLLQTLHRHGAETLVVQADVADRQLMAQAVTRTVERFGALHGVIHAAGLVGEQALQPVAELVRETWDQQFRAKAAGLQVLVEVLEGYDLDFCLLQSSLAAILGGLGMAAYAAANRYMDALAQARQGLGDRRWISVNWDGWQFGSAVASGAGAKLMALAIHPEEGVLAFEDVLRLDGLAQVAVSTADLGARLAQYVGEERLAEPEAGQPAQGEGGHARPTLRTAYEAPGDPLEREIVALWEKILGISPVGVHDDFFELGGHSLLATQVVSRLRDSYGMDLPLRALFESPTVAGLARLIRAGRKAPEAVPAGALQRVPREGALPLSYGQQRLWFLDQLEPGSPLYNNFAALEMKGAVDPAALERALAVMVERHEILRTVFQERVGQPGQVIRDQMAVPLPVTDLQHLRSQAEREAEVARMAAQEARQPFDLATGPLLRAKLLRLAEQEHVLFFTMHHIVSDGWSVGVLVREVVALYESEVAGTAAQLPALPIQYVDWAAWQRDLLQSERREGQLAYWREQLANAAVLELPTDRPRPAIQTSRGASEWFEIPLALYGQLEALGQEAGTTLFMTLAAALQALLSRTTGQEDICIGAPIANRGQPETEGLIGFLLNTLVLRVDLRGDPTFRELLGRVREVALSAYAHQDLPFEMLVEELQPQRDMSRSPFFQVMLDLQVAPLASGGAAGRPGPKGISLRPLPVDAGTAKFDLALSLIEPAGIGSDEETLGGFLNYNTDLFDRESIVRMVGHFVMLLEGAVADPDRRLSQLPLLTAAEAAELAAWSAAAAGGETPHTVAEMFEAQASRTPEAVAVVVDGDGRQLTYEALNRRANRLGRALMAEGAGPERLVVLLMERSPDMIVAILSVLKAGAAFVPLDPATPRERLAFILEETEAVVVLTEERLLPGLGLAKGTRVICVDGDWGTLAGVADDNPQPCVEAQSLAYVIYTSGSTGRPKGVLITQGAIASHIEDVVQHFELSEKDRVLQFAAYTFDQGLEQMLATLVAGGTLVMRGTEVWPAAGFAEVVQRQQLTVINLPPAYWNQVIQAAAGVPAPQLRLIIVGGDALAPEGLRLWAQSPWRQARLLNAYGPTEATITATTYQVSPEVALAERQRPLPIGRPLRRRAAQVLDRHGNPVPIGVAGELTLGGAGLARGYLGRPGLTAERFVPDGSGNGARAYRTGDLVRWLPGGILEFLGRTDQQVKIRGFRVELGEIEAVLSAHPVVQDAVVLVRDDGADGTDGQWMGTGKRLVAYVVPARGTSDVTPGELRAYLEEKLPAYMVPQAFLVLHALPLTASGKVNRRALPAPDPSQAQIETVYVGPRTPIEEDLVVIWRQVLGLEQVGVYDNFFALGGHSLLATQILARLRESYPVELPLRRLFETPTVAGLAETIEEGLVGQEDEEELARLLAELEGLSNEEASRMLGHQARAPGRE